MAALILIVDDSRLVRRQVGAFLRQKGHRVIEAGDGKEAIERLSAEQPALIICDVNMPRMNGIEFLEELQARPAPNIPVLMLTAENQPSILAQAKQMGAVGWIVKPLNRPMLGTIVEHILNTGG